MRGDAGTYRWPTASPTDARGTCPVDDAGVDRSRCAHCAEIIGVYEPMRLLLPDGTDQRGYALTLADQLTLRGTTVVHERCSEGLSGAQAGAAAEPGLSAAP